MYVRSRFSLLNAIAATVALVFLFDHAVSKSYGSESEISVSELINIFESEDRRQIEESLMALQERHPRDGDPIYGVLLDIWKQDEAKFPAVKWNLAEAETVRIRIGLILLQAWGARLFEFSPKELVHFARRSLYSRNSEVRDIALWSLEYVESDGVVRDIAKVAAREERQSFKIAITNLVAKCSNEAKAAIAALEEKIRKDQNREYLQSAKRKLEAFRGKFNARFCPRVCVECES